MIYSEHNEQEKILSLTKTNNKKTILKNMTLVMVHGQSVYLHHFFFLTFQLYLDHKISLNNLKNP